VFDNHRREDFKTYVYRTDDYVKTWKSLATPDLRGYAHVMEQDPGDRDLLFLGTEFGLWVSNDGGAHWMRWSHGVPPAPVMGLAIQPRELDLVIGTHGRSIYVIDDIRPLRTLSETTMAEPVHLYGASPAQQHWNAGEPGGFGLGAGEYRGENEPYGAILTYSLSGPGLPYPDEKKERARKESEREAQLRQAEARPDLGVPQTAGELQEKEGAGGAAAKPAAELKGKAPKETEKPKTEGKTEDKHEVEVRVADSSGKTIRTFTSPVQQGLNRAVWGLRRDAPKPSFPRPEPPQPHPAGLEVAPGTYAVTIKYGDHEAKGTVQVLPDPRSRNTEADWRAREAASRRGEALLQALAEAVERVRNTRADVDAVLAKLQSRKKDEEPAGPNAKADAKPDPLVESGGKLKEGLDKLERQLWQPYDVVGIQPETDALTQVFNAFGYVLSSWAPPSPTHLEYLGQAEKTVDATLADVNRFFATDVAAFRKAADAAGVRLLPDLGKVEVKRP